MCRSAIHVVRNYYFISIILMLCKKFNTMILFIHKEKKSVVDTLYNSSLDAILPSSDKLLREDILEIIINYLCILIYESCLYFTISTVIERMKEKRCLFFYMSISLTGIKNQC